MVAAAAVVVVDTVAVEDIRIEFKYFYRIHKKPLQILQGLFMYAIKIFQDIDRINAKKYLRLILGRLLIFLFYFATVILFGINACQLTKKASSKTELSLFQKSQGSNTFLALTDIHYDSTADGKIGMKQMIYC